MPLNLRCIKNRIIFKFNDEVGSGSFDNKTDWGFEIKNPVKDVDVPRWAEVLAIGKDVKAVKPGNYILIEPLMWSLSFTHEGEKYWVTDETKLIAMSEVAPKGTL